MRQWSGNDTPVPSHCPSAVSSEDQNETPKSIHHRGTEDTERFVGGPLCPLCLCGECLSTSQRDQGIPRTHAPPARDATELFGCGSAALCLCGDSPFRFCHRQSIAAPRRSKLGMTRTRSQRAE